MATKIRLGELAASINTTPKTLQNWFARYNHIQPKAKQEGTWFEFSWGDVAAFAITIYLIDFGMDVPTSFTHAEAIVERRWPDLYLDEPRWSLTASNAYIEFDVSPGLRVGEANKWWSMIDPDEESADRISKGLKKDLRATIRLFVGFIIHDAFSALAEMGHRPPPLKRTIK
jgi:hypothetical protein